MKAKSALIASIATVGIASAAYGDQLVVPVNFSWGATPGTGSTTANFVLPALVSVDSITVTMAHTWASDIDMYIDAPGGGTFDYDLMYGDGGSGDLGIVAGSGAPGNVAPYTFVASGGAATMSGAPLIPSPGPYNANSWLAGPIAAGGYVFHMNDAVGGDGGTIGTVTINYTPVPAPGALALLGLAGVVGMRRRRLG